MPTVFHGTSSKNLPSILKDGLQPGRAEGADKWASVHGFSVAAMSRKRAPSVFVTTSVGNAAAFATYSALENGGVPICLKIDVPEHDWRTRFVEDELSGDGRSAQQNFRTTSVPPAWITDSREVPPELAVAAATLVLPDSK